jgi:hypothetical protein
MVITDPTPYGGRIGAYAAPRFPKDVMSIRLIGALLCGAGFVFITTGGLAEENRTKTSKGGPTQQSLTIQQALVGVNKKASKSNTGDRTGGTGSGAGKASVQDLTVRKAAGGGTGTPKALRDTDPPRGGGRDNDPSRGGQGMDLPGRR